MALVDAALPQPGRPAEPGTRARATSMPTTPAGRCATALRMARGIASAVAHLHARGILHGDLYGHNILWNGRGRGPARRLRRGLVPAARRCGAVAGAAAHRGARLRLPAGRAARALRQRRCGHAGAAGRRSRRAACDDDPAERPLFDEIAAALRPLRWPACRCPRATASARAASALPVGDWPTIAEFLVQRFRGHPARHLGGAHRGRRRGRRARPARDARPALPATAARLLLPRARRRARHPVRGAGALPGRRTCWWSTSRTSCRSRRSASTCSRACWCG